MPLDDLENNGVSAFDRIRGPHRLSFLPAASKKLRTGPASGGAPPCRISAA